MAHKIYGQNVIVFSGAGELTASTDTEMSALLVVDNVGKVVKFVGEDTTLYKKDSFYLIKYIGGFAVGDKPDRVYFNTDITPDLSFAANYITVDNAVYNIITCDGQVIPDDGILQISVFTPSSEIGTSLGLSNNMYWLTAGDCTAYLQCSEEDVDKLSTLGIGRESINTWLHTDVSLNVSATADLTITSVATETEKYWSVFVSSVQNNIVAEHLYELPILTNEGTAADLAQGKELINSNGEKIVGTASGGGDIGSGNYTVKVIDYDGTVLLEKKGNTGDVIDLPTAPTHDKLVFQEWSASVAVSDNKVTIADNDIMVGAVYTTASGQNEFDITLTKVTGLSVTLNMDGTKDWGDGTSDTETTHTYTAYGDYTIKCNGTTMTTSSSAGLFGQSNSAKNYYVVTTRLATVTSIGSSAFRFCHSLTNMAIPSGVTNISSYAFDTCYSLTSIVIPSGVTNIYDYAFGSCSSLTSIVIPSGVTRIGNSAFGFCYSLTNMAIPSGVTNIYDYAFSGCSSLTSVVIPSSVTSISSYAFNSCYSLTSIVISSGVKYIQYNAFCYCYSLTSIVIPNGVTSISDEAFLQCYSLTSVVIPSSVTSIGNGAFDGCYSLTSIVIPSGVTSIGNSAFNGCYPLTSIVIPLGVTSIKSYAFNSCRSLTKYDFSQHTSVPTLSNTNAFNNINKIAKIIVPDSLYDEWIAASNWSSYADYIYKASEVA